MSDVNINRKNFLTKVRAVQDLYQEHKKPGVTDVHIYKTYIYPQYYISKPTFYKYLSINAKRELAQIAEKLKSTAPLLVLILFAFSCQRDISAPDPRLIIPIYRVHVDTVVHEIELAPYEVTVHDTVECPPSDTVFLKGLTRIVRIPGKTITVEVPKVDSTILLRYTASEEKLERELAKARKDAASVTIWKDKARARLSWMWLFIISAMLLMGTYAYMFLKKE
jgi:hypothetical protein